MLPEPSTPRFEILRRLGAGGCGVVYEARDRERGGRVALKTLTELEPRALYRFKREFRALADVTHPALLPLYELLSADGTWFFTMELVEGTDFLSWVRGQRLGVSPMASTVRATGARPPIRESSADAITIPRIDTPSGASPPARSPSPGAPPLDADRLRETLRQLVGGVAALHAHGLVHRDLKPSNVLVAVDGRVRVLDFGLVAGRADASEGFAGTPIYMSPEQAAGRPTDAESDWYAVGVMLYEALTGETPHEGSLLSLIVQKNQNDPPPPSARVPDVDPTLEALTMALLARDPAARPSGAEILRRLGTPPADVIGSLPPAPRSDVLVGRERHLATLRDAFAEARSAAVVTRVVGASGAGKSHLVARFLDEVGEAALSFSGRSFERETVPYVALDGIVDAIARHLHGLPEHRAAALAPSELGALRTVFPVLAALSAAVPGVGADAPSLEPHELRRVAARALRDLLAAVAADRPAIVHLDDAHWGDADSAPFLLELLRLPRILLLLVHRPNTEDTPLLAALDAAGALRCAETVEVGPLSADDVRQLVRLVSTDTADEDGSLADRIAAESHGNAMFAYELASRSVLRPAGATLDALLAHRVAGLDDAARALLEVVSVASGPVSRAVAECAARTGDRSVPALRALTASRLLRVAGDRTARRLAPYHDRIREVADASLDAPTRRARHLSLADAHVALEEATPEVLSYHLHAAGEHGRALPHTLAAARRASAALAFDRAATLFTKVVEHLDRDDPERAARLTELGDALAHAGRGADAAGAYLDAVAVAPPAQALALRRLATEQLLRSGRVDRGLAALDGILDELALPLSGGGLSSLAAVLFARARLAVRGTDVQPRPADAIDPTTLTRIDACFALGTALTMIDPLRGLELSQRGIRMAIETGEPGRAARALALEATFAIRNGIRGYDRAQALLARARELAESVADPYALAAIPLCGAMVELLSGRWPEALAELERAEPRLAACPGTSWERETAQRHLLKVLYHAGGLARLKRTVTPAIELAVDRRDLYAEVSLRTRIGYLTSLMDDRPEDAGPAIDAAMARWPGRHLLLQHYFALVARVEVDLYRGDGAAAASRVEARWGALARSQLLRGHYVGTEGRHLRARAALAAGDRRLALAMARILGKGTAPWSRGLAALVVGGAHATASPERAIAAFEEAERTLDGASMRLFAAAARFRRGALLGGDEGTALVEGAAAAFSAEEVRAPERMIDVFAPILR